jgi:hypothetical protein
MKSAFKVVVGKAEREAYHVENVGGRSGKCIQTR